MEKKRELVYNNILRKKKASKTMNYSFDIQSFDATCVPVAPKRFSVASQKQKPSHRQTKTPKKNKVKISSFSWSKTEERKYINFLKAHGQLFGLSHKERKEIKINVMMSYAIKTRTSAQCHSHHQKMMLKFSSIEKIIEGHCHVFDKEARPEHIQASESIQVIAETPETIQIDEEFIVSEDSKPQPIWWRYLGLNDEQEDLAWKSNCFFFE